MRRLRPFQRSRLLRPDKISPAGHSAYRNHKRLSCRLPVYARSVFPFHHNQISQFFLPDLSRAFTLQKNPQIFQLLLTV